MSYEDLPEQNTQTKTARLIAGVKLIFSQMGAGFEESNKGLELGAREDRIVAVSSIPDYVPDDWN